MWGLVLLGGAGLALGLPLIAQAAVWICLVPFLWRARVGERLSQTPDPRISTAEAVRHVFELASSRFKPVDVDELRRELAALDDYVTPQTFEYIQLTRALMLHLLDGGSPAAANATRWRGRMTDIAIEWFPMEWAEGRQGPAALAATGRHPIVGFRSPSSVVRSLALGSGHRAGPRRWRSRRGSSSATSCTWTDQLLVAATGLVRFVVGLAASTGLQILECPSCGWTRTIATIAAISLVGLLSAAFLILRKRKRKPAPQLSVVAPHLGRTRPELPQP